MKFEKKLYYFKEPIHSSCCRICYRNVNKSQASFKYCQCNSVVHSKCYGSSPSIYSHVNICIICTILNNSTISPFTLQNDETLLGITSSDLPSLADFLPSANLQVSQEDFSLFHMNIRSLSLHHDERTSFLSNLKGDFKVIGLSEVKASVDAITANSIGLPAYKFYYIPSNSAAGGVGIYVKSDLNAITREYLSFSNSDFETIWIEIDNS